MNERTARLALGLGLPAALMALAGIPLLVFGGDLPNPVATHFELSGRSDGSMALGGFFFMTGLMIIVGLAGCVTVALVRRPLGPTGGALGAFAGAFLAGLGTGILTATVFTQHGIEQWQEARLPFLWIAWVVGLALVAGGAATRLGASLPSATAVTTGAPDASPTLDLAPGERAVWSTNMRSAWLFHLGLGLILVAIPVTIFTGAWAATGLVVAGLATMNVASVQVRADRSGLHVRYGKLPWPRTDVAIGRIGSARVIDVKPSEWGGWGYRGSLRLMRHAALVLRGGPGMRLDLTDGRVFVVTVDQPEEPVALLNALSARQGA